MEKKDLSADQEKKKKTGAGESRQRLRMSLAFKLNLLTALVLIGFMLGIIVISYTSQRKMAMMSYNAELVTASGDAVEALDPERAAHLTEWIRTDGFAEAQARALEDQNEEILVDWMRNAPGLYAGSCLYDDYEELRTTLLKVKARHTVSDMYISFITGGNSFILLRPFDGLWLTGRPEEGYPELSGYAADKYIFPTVVNTDIGPVLVTRDVLEANAADGTVCAVVLEVNMQRVARESRMFVVNSLVLFSLLTLACIMINIFLIRRTAVRPLERLSARACSFGAQKGRLTMDDVIDADIRSNDEISDLYHEIQSMQERIVRYTYDIERFTEEKTRAATEMHLAASIQSSMLKTGFPVFPEREEIDLFASMDPAKEVGGDFYDFFFIDEDRLALVIADVSGKGIPAALLMMMAMVLLRTRAKSGGTPSQILSAVNTQLCQNNSAEMFVTVWLGILDVRDGTMVCSSAGHEYPAVCGADGVFRLLRDHHGFVLGGMEGARYSDYTLVLERGDRVFVYTDGVPEANDRNGAFFGTDRMLDALNTAADGTPEEVLTAVRRAVDTFTDGAEPFDDLTMLCLSYAGKDPADPGK